MNTTITFEEFQERNKLFDLSEIDKIAYTAYYLYKACDQKLFVLNDIIKLLEENNYAKPNLYRLKNKLKKDSRFVCKNNLYGLNPKTISLFNKEIILKDYEKIDSNSEFINEELFKSCPHYLKRLVYQVNCSYKNNLFDAVAVLIRRIFEILLIKVYENYNEQEEVKENGNYIMLEKICEKIVKNKTINLTRSRSELDKIRNIGNFSAHKLEYNANHTDIEKIKNSYRTITEELLYKSGYIE